jgi:hypothetical protein
LCLWALQYGPDPRDLFYQAAINAAGSSHDFFNLIVSCLAEVEKVDEPGNWSHLVAGDWLVTHLGLSGPALGAALAALRRAEIRGEVNNPDEARIFLRASVLK